MKTARFKTAADVSAFLARETLALDALAKLTDIQRAALASLLPGPQSVWNYGSTTINRLRTAGLITVVGGFAQLTTAGRAEAEKGGAK